MLARLRACLTYANVMATMALMLALSGGAYAAFKVPKKSVGAAQLKKGAVTRAKLHRGAVSASKVANNSLTGRQIKAGTLGLVPNAAHAGSASIATMAGSAAHGARRLDFHAAATDPAPASSNAPAAHTLLRLDELTVKASCIDAGGGIRRVRLSFTTSVDAQFSAELLNTQGGAATPGMSSFPITTGPPRFGTAGIVSLTAPSNGINIDNGQWIYRTPAHTITIAMHIAAGASEYDCDVMGTAVAAG